MSRPSRLDAHADWLIMRANQPYNRIAKDFSETFATSVTDDAIRKWFKSRDKSGLKDVPKATAELAVQVTSQMIEGEWGQLLVEARTHYTTVKTEADKLRWHAARANLVGMLLKALAPTLIIKHEADESGNVRLAMGRIINDFINDMPQELREGLLTEARRQGLLG